MYACNQPGYLLVYFLALRFPVSPIMIWIDVRFTDLIMSSAKPKYFKPTRVQNGVSKFNSINKLNG